MTSPVEHEVQTGRFLGVLGVSALEESVYRALLRKPGSTVETLAQTLSVSDTEVAMTVGELERKGFASFAPERVPKLFPSPPDIAIESLLLHRQQEMQRARLAIVELQREQMKAEALSPVAEVIDADPAAQAQPYAQCHKLAIEEVLCLMRPPFLVSAPDRDETARDEARKRGVRYRNIVHPDTLALPGWIDMLKRDQDAGEEIRLLADFPFKMIVADRAIGLLPLKAGEPAGAMLLVRRSAVLDALCELFESLWLKSVPIRFASDGSYSLAAESAFPSQLEPMIPLLATGLQDKVAAERLGISERTLVRRLDLLYQTLNARSRFQAGWLAALLSLSVKKAG